VSTRRCPFRVGARRLVVSPLQSVRIPHLIAPMAMARSMRFWAIPYGEARGNARTEPNAAESLERNQSPRVHDVRRTQIGTGSTP